MVTLNFDANQHEPQGDFQPVPNGWYNVAIEESEMKPTKAGDGAYLNLMLNILDGQYAGQKLFCRLNLQNKNPVASDIAVKQLSAICHAVGVMMVQDSQQLHGRPFQVRAILKPAADGYDASNDIKAFKACDGPGAAAGGQAGGDPAWANNQGGQTQEQPPQNWGGNTNQNPPQNNENPPQNWGNPPQEQTQQNQGSVPPSGTPPWAAGEQQTETPPQNAAQTENPPPQSGGTPPWAQPQG